MAKRNPRISVADRAIKAQEPVVTKDQKVIIPVQQNIPFGQQVEKILLGKYKNALNESNKEVFSSFLDVDALQEAGQGTRIPYVSTLYGNFLINPSSISLGTFQKMIGTDDVIRRSYELDVSTIVDGIGEYYHDDPKIQEFIRYAFKHLRHGRDELFRKALSCMWAGFWVGLMMPKKDKNGYTILDDVMHLPPLSVQFTATPQGDVDKVFQYVYNYPYAGTQNALSIMYSAGNSDQFVGGGGFNGYGIDSQASLGDMDYPFRTNFINTFGLVELDKNRVVHMIYDKYNGKINPYGYSLLRDIHPIWLRKTLTLRLYTSAMGRCANPALIGYADAKKVIETPMGQMPINAVEALYNTLQTYTEESAIILPGLKGQMFEVDVVDYKGDFSVYEKALEYQDKSMENALFIPSGLFSSDSSYAGATAQNSIYARMMNSISNELEHTILEQVVAYLIHENFDKDITDYGRFDTKLQNLDDQLKQAKIYESLTTLGYMNPSFKPQSDLVLKTLGQAELTDEQFEELQKVIKEKQEEEQKSTMDNSGKTNLKDTNSHYKKRSDTDVN